MWGTTPLQRLRLAPLWQALVAADGLGRRSPRAPVELRAHRDAPGLAVVIPERDAPDLLGEALAALAVALAGVGEPVQVVVVVNGAAPEAYAALQARHPAVEFLFHRDPLGFSAAIARGLAAVRHDWVYLMNNDVVPEADAFVPLLAARGPTVFSISSQILQQSASGRREETGFTDWYADRGGIRAFHAPVPTGSGPFPHLAGSGGATLFRTGPLRRYVRGGRCYDPFYWEDLEWGLCARRDGFEVLFAPASRVHHHHRRTTARFYAPEELDRIVERNRLLFDLRHAASALTRRDLMDLVCQAPYATQRELARMRVARDVPARRIVALQARDLPRAPVLSAPHRAVSALASGSFSWALRPPLGRPRLLVATPFAVYPPRHGGARRIAGLLDALKRDFDVALVTDEATLHDARSFGGFDGLARVWLVQRPEDPPFEGTRSLTERMQTHCHPGMFAAMQAALEAFRPQIVQVEYAELAPLARLRGDGQRWVLGLHDAYGPDDFATPDHARRFAQNLVGGFAAVTVCSAEDQALVHHERVLCIPNASSIPLSDTAPSRGTRMLFMGPFRYAPNAEGVRRFLDEAFPAIRAAVPDATLRVLGGDGALRDMAGDPRFAQDGVEVLDHREDVAALLDDCALTINPLTGIRGSSIKVVESLCAGRVCVSTDEGARGFAGLRLDGLLTVPTVAAMAEPILRLLANAPLRQRLERPDRVKLAPYQWDHAAALQRDLYRELLGTGGG